MNLPNHLPTSAAPEPINTGDTVRLRSGGPRMTVDQIKLLPITDVPTWANCVWINDAGHLQQHLFQLTSLVSLDRYPQGSEMAELNRLRREKDYFIELLRKLRDQGCLPEGDLRYEIYDLVGTPKPSPPKPKDYDPAFAQDTGGDRTL